MICLACNALRTPRGGEGNASSRVSAGVARRAVGAVVAVTILGASCTDLDADVCVAARCGGIAVIVKLAKAQAGRATRRTSSSILSHATLNTWSDAVGVRVRKACRALDAAAHRSEASCFPVLACIAHSAGSCRVAITIHLSCHAFVALSLATSCVSAS